MENTQKEQRKAFGYLRVSGKGQIEGDGFPRQRAEIQRWAAANGVIIVRWFEEKGVSGKTDLENRPALNELFQALNSNGVRTVLIERLDRLGRDLMIQENLLAQFVKQGFEIVSVTEPKLCDDDTTRVLIRQMLGAISQFDKNRIVEKLKAARQRKRQQTGRCEGRKAYGTRTGEQENIQRIVSLHASGQNYSEIALTMNAEGRATRTKNSKWYPTTVANIIRHSAA